MEAITHNPEETIALGRSWAEKVKPGDVIALYGDLGTGKTTFMQGMMQGLGIEQRVTSPTFVVMKMYTAPDTTTIFHLDLYRTQSLEEVKALGIGDFLGSDKMIVFIEWAEKMASLLPEKTVKIHFNTLSDSERKINADWH